LEALRENQYKNLQKAKVQKNKNANMLRRWARLRQ
jgi:hypothetical protein